MAKYTVELVSGNVKDVTTKFGAMKVYKLSLEGEGETVDFMTSPSTSAPRVGDILEGVIGHNDFGAYFKKDKKPFSPQGFGSQQSKPVANTDAMFVSYAKDFMIAYLNAINWDFDKLDEVKLNYVLSMTVEGAKTLQQKDTE